MKNKIGRTINATRRRDDGNDLKSSVQSSHDSSGGCDLADMQDTRRIGR